MRKDWADGGLAVKTKMLRDKSDNGHCNAEKAVLKDSKPDDLNQLVNLRSGTWSLLTLNQVKPLRGVRQMPLSPQQHALNQPIGTGKKFPHGLGVMQRKNSL